MWQADVGQTADQSAAQARQLHEEGLVLLLDHLVLVLDALQVLLHGRDLQQQTEPGSLVPLRVKQEAADRRLT